MAKTCAQCGSIQVNINWVALVVNNDKAIATLWFCSPQHRDVWEVFETITAETTDAEIAGLAKTLPYNQSHAVFYLDLRRKRLRGDDSPPNVEGLALSEALAERVRPAEEPLARDDADGEQTKWVNAWNAGRQAVLDAARAMRVVPVREEQV